MDQSPMPFKQPTLVDRLINRGFGFLISIGFGLPHNYLLEVRGRKSGTTYSTPVNLLAHEGIEYLVAPRGYTQWVRNVMVSHEANLVKGGKRRKVRLSEVREIRKPEILKAYLDRYKLTVQRYFPIPAGSPKEKFEPLVGRYPVFEIESEA